MNAILNCNFRSKSTISYTFLVGNVSLHVTKSGYRNPVKFCLWNPDFGRWNTEYSSRNPESHQRLESESNFHWQRIRNTESKTVFDFLTKVETFSTRKGPKVKLYLQFHVGLTHIIRLKANRKTFHEEDYWKSKLTSGQKALLKRSIAWPFNLIPICNQWKIQSVRTSID